MLLCGLDQRRVGKELGSALDGRVATGRGEYRALCMIDGRDQVVTALAVARLRDAYRAQVSPSGRPASSNAPSLSVNCSSGTSCSK